MCEKCKATHALIIVGIVGVTLLIGLLRHVFSLSTFDIILLTPVVMVIGFAYTIKLMSDVEFINFALLAIFAIPICCIYAFVVRIRILLELWSSLKIFWKMGNIFLLTFLAGK
ncbi:uncharacterized protein LOC128254740 [Drosophila gunungcola]|uniref:uncharacterized protein LOC128254740 n=1 Tax=Drosophila gunungcola TaxID=103775 RepID=UPI0022E86FF3|nr:uncharacterized protein LOC128254740 [Drosophila gunungcola]